MKETPEQRSRIMRAVKGADTAPEMTVRRLIHGMGFRFRLHRKDLPGKPDIVLPRLHKVVFVNGCFWHMHSCRKGQKAPVTNAEFWQDKRQRTVDRDKRTLQTLAAAGWESYVVWECALADRTALQHSLEGFLSQGNMRNGKRRKASG